MEDQDPAQLLEDIFILYPNIYQVSQRKGKWVSVECRNKTSLWEQEGKEPALNRFRDLGDVRGLWESARACQQAWATKWTKWAKWAHRQQSEVGNRHQGRVLQRPGALGVDHASWGDWEAPLVPVSPTVLVYSAEPGESVEVESGGICQGPSRVCDS